MNTKDVPKFGNLSGVKVVLHGVMVAAPFAAELMAENGATVIQLESPLAVDGLRNSKTPCIYLNERKNVLGMNLNLVAPQGKEVLFKLLETTDIFIEGNKGGTYEKWGLTDEVLWEVNPRLVIVHVSGYGQSGDPDYVNRPAYDAVAQAFGGYVYLNGEPEPNPPLRAAPNTCDYVTALFAYGSAMAALFNAQRTGKGESIDVALYETMWKIQGNTPVNYFRNGIVMGREGNANPGVTCCDAMKCKDGEYIFLAVAGAGPTRKAIEFFGLVNDPMYPQSYNANRKGDPAADRLENIFREYCLEHDSDELDKTFAKAGIPASRIYNIKTIQDNPHVISREVFTEWEDPYFGEVKGLNVIPKMKNNPGRIWRGAPLFGMDNEGILKEMGYTQEQIEELYNKKIIVKTPENGGYKG